VFVVKNAVIGMTCLAVNQLMRLICAQLDWMAALARNHAS